MISRGVSHDTGHARPLEASVSVRNVLRQRMFLHWWSSPLATLTTLHHQHMFLVTLCSEVVPTARLHIQRCGPASATHYTTSLPWQTLCELKYHLTNYQLRNPRLTISLDSKSIEELPLKTKMLSSVI